MKKKGLPEEAIWRNFQPANCAAFASEQRLRAKGSGADAKATPCAQMR
jgi:hypothetical protein